MLVAVTETGERVVAARYKSAHELRSKYPLEKLLCPLCKQAVFPVREKGSFGILFINTSV